VTLLSQAEDVFTACGKQTAQLLRAGLLTLDSCSKHGCMTSQVLKRYLKLRMHIHASFVTEQLSLKAQYASCSAVARTTIK